MSGSAAVRRRVRVELRPEGGKAVGGAGLPGGKGAGAAEIYRSIAAESAPCEVLVREGACWVITVAGGADIGRARAAVRRYKYIRQKSKRRQCRWWATSPDGRDGGRRRR